ncbi:MAG: hypothetical protein ACT4NL_06960 [Pseudomarimonas sp.]
MTRIRVALFAILLSLASIASAQGLPTPHNLRVVPSSTTAGQPVVARFLELCSEGNFDAPSVSVLGTVVTVSRSFDSGPCIGTPPPPPDVDVPLGAFGQGSYSLRYSLRNRNSNVTTIETVPFLVAADAGVFPNLRVVPNPAIAGQSVVARLTLSFCQRPIQPATVAVTGNNVTLTLVAPEPCVIGVPPPPMDVNFALGALPAGSYTLTYLSRSPSGALLYSESTQFGVVPVIGIPLASTQVLILLAALLGAFAMWRLGGSAKP